MIRYFADETQDKVEIELEGDLATLAAEAGGMLASTYLTILEQDPGSAQAFAEALREMAADEEHGCFSRGMMDAAAGAGRGG